MSSSITLQYPRWFTSVRHQLEDHAHLPVFIAAPGFGHVLPLAHLAHFTAVSGATATFLASNVPIHHLERVGELDAIKHENLRILALPTDGTVTWDDMSAGPQAIMKLYHQMLEPCRAILHALAGKPSENTNDSLLVDFSTKTPLIKDVAPAMAIVGSPFIFFGPEIARSLSMRWTTFIDTSIIGSIVTLRMAEAAASDKLGSIAKDGIDIPGVFHLSDKELINVFEEATLTPKSPTMSSLLKLAHDRFGSPTDSLNSSPSLTIFS